MTFLRSLLFHCAFYACNLFLCVAMIWVLVLPRRWAFKCLFYGYFNILYQLEKYILGLDYRVTGREHIPTDGSYIIAMKHQSVYETLKMFHIFGDVRILLKKQLAWIPLWGWYALKVGMISVDRSKGKIAIQSILKNAAPVVNDGVPILVYPQGTRVSIKDTIKTRPYKQGVIRLYDHFNIPILPVAMNAGKFWSRQGFMIQSGVIDFKILPIIESGLDSDIAQQKMQDVIERESQKLLD